MERRKGSIRVCYFMSCALDMKKVAMTSMMGVKVVVANR